jgi:hypothetical protein
LFSRDGAVAPALLVGGFGPQDEGQAAAIAETAAALGDLYGSDPPHVAPELRQACATVNDDRYRVLQKTGPRYQLVECEEVFDS